MDVLMLLLILCFGLFVAAKVLWKSGFLAGRDHEAMLWLESIDKLFVPNWQSLPVGKDEGLTPEELKFANQVYAAAYRAALDHIKVDIANVRREALEKFKATQEPEHSI
jgi:hypothetical protein